MELQFQLLNTYCTRWYPMTTTKPKKKKHGELYTSTSTCLYYCPSIYFEIKWRVHSSKDSAEWNWKCMCNHSFTPIIYSVALEHDNWFVLSGNAKYVYLREEIFAWIAWDWVWNKSRKLIPRNIQSFGLSIMKINSVQEHPPPPLPPPPSLCKNLFHEGYLSVGFIVFLLYSASIVVELVNMVQTDPDLN